MHAVREMADRGVESEVYFGTMHICALRIMWLLMLRESNGVRCEFSADSRMIE